MKITVLAAAAVLALPIAANAAPEPQCFDTAKVRERLAGKYDEAPVAVGLHTNGQLVEVWVSKEKNTWTIISTKPNGESCISGAGTDWETLPFLAGTPS